MANKWCIKPNSLEEAKILFPFFNQEFRKYGKSWGFNTTVPGHRDYYVFLDNSCIDYSVRRPLGFEELTLDMFVSLFINKPLIHELW